MRKPRETWTAEENALLDERAFAAMARFADTGEFVSYETCRMMVELSYCQSKLEEIKQWMSDRGIYGTR